jgi:hypothetical protein
VSAATVGLNTTTAAFNRARSLALSAVRAVAQSPVCPTGNVYAGAVGTHILSLPGLTINRYQKAGRTPIWVTSVNLAGAGPQIRPGPLTPPVVAIRTQPLSQLHGSSALAAVNGDFYNIGQDNSPLGPEITRGGHVLKGSAAPRTNVLIVQRNGLATVDTVTLDVTLRHGAAAVHANSLNSHDLPGNGIAVLTSAWGPASRSYLHPTQAVNEFIVAPGGLVVAVSGRITARPIPARGMVIIAQGTGRQRMAAAGIRTGARISISTPVHSGAPGPVYSAIGVGIALIRHGIDKRLGCKDDFPVARTIVGIKAGGQQLFVVTVQGGSDSQRSNFTGLSVRQAQGLVRALGAYDAAMFDGGGSTELSAKVGRAYKMISRPPLRIRSIPNSFAFWPR